MKKIKKEKKQKVYTQEKFNKLLKITLGSYVIVSLVSAFTSNFVLAALTILCIVLLYIVIKRKPMDELPKYLQYVSESNIDISKLPNDYQEKMRAIFTILYQDAEKNNRLNDECIEVNLAHEN